MKKIYLILIGIFLLGFLLRFYRLGEIPIGFHRDEANLGYNAYSILNTGREMSGDFLPLHLKSFLFSPALYSYFSIPFIFIFGLSEFSTRFSSAFFGSLTVIPVFLLSLALLSKEKDKYFISLLSSLFFTISPWSINLSRVATENVIVVFLITFGIYFYNKWIIGNKIKFFIISTILFTISIYTYQAPRGFLPLFLPLMFLIFAYKQKKKLIISFIIYSIFIILPILSILISHNLSLRIRMLSIFNSPSTQLVLDEKIREDGVMNITPMIARVFDNKLSSYAQTFISSYSDHLSFRFLFTDQGFPDRYRVSGFGLLYLYELPFLILGLWFLVNKHKKIFIFFVTWILMVPIGSALTFDDVPNLQRTFIIFPTLSIISALGFYVSWFYLTSIKKYKKITLFAKILLCTIIIFSFFTYLYSYYVHQVVHKTIYRQEGYKELVATVNNFDRVNNYKSIVVTTAQSDPGIFFIFFNKIDPLFIQKFARTDSRGEYQLENFGKYVFVNDECPIREVLVTDKITLQVSSYIKGEPGVLYVDNGACQIPKTGVNVLTRILRPDQTTAFIIAEIEKKKGYYGNK